MEIDRKNLTYYKNKVQRAQLEMRRGDSTEKKDKAVSDQGNNMDQESSKEDISQKRTQTAGNLTPDKLHDNSIMEGQDDDQMEFNDVPNTVSSPVKSIGYQN